MKQLLSIAACIFFVLKAEAQSVSINTDGSIADASSLLDVKSTGKGVLIPRMSKAQKNAIAAPATGLLVFQDAPDSTGFYYYNGTAWLWLATANNNTAWTTTGNSGTDTAVNFIGTTDNMPLRFKQNNQWLGQFNANNQTYFIGQNAGIANTTAIGNVAFGGNALKSNSVGRRNTVMGDSAMFSQSFANGGVAYDQDNTAIGSKALFFNQPTSTGTGAKNTAVGSEALYLNTTGNANTAVGTGAMHDNTTGAGNTAVGRSTHRLAGRGSFNSYFGFQAGFTDSTGTQNTGIGANTLASSYGVNNTAVGYSSLFNDTTGSSNTAIGVNTGVNLRSGNSNFFGGVSAGGNMIGGNNNVALGAFALAIGGVTQNNNVAIGAESLLNNAATGNTAVGYQSLRGNTSGIQNTGIGLSALLLNSSGGGNTAVGNLALSGNTAGFSNTALGASSMLNTTGSNNTGVGFGSLNILTTGTFNTAMGDNAGVGIGSLINTTAVGARARVDTSNAMVLGSIAGVAGATANTSVAIGVTKPAPSALLELSNTTKGTLLTRMSKAQRNAIASPATGLVVYQNAPDSTGFYYYNGTAWLWMATATNTAAGWSTIGNAGTDTSVNFIGTTDNMPIRFKQNNGWVGQFNKNAANYFIGSGAGQKNISDNNVAIGDSAFSNSISGFANVAIGAFAMQNDTSSIETVAVGMNALKNGRFTLSNTAIGINALRDAGVNRTALFQGDFNTAIGYNSGMSIRKGLSNVSIGANALQSDTSGIRNVAIGVNAARSQLNGSNNVAIGSQALFGNYTGDDKIAIGTNSLLSDTSAIGNIAIGTGAMEFAKRGLANVALGTRALAYNPSGSHNVAIGDSALMFNNFLVASGDHFTNNTAVGYKSLFSNTPTSAINGINNTAVGSEALSGNTSGNSNTAVGTSTLTANGIGVFNTAIGASALKVAVNGFGNTAVGYETMVATTSGISNTAMGNSALWANTFGSQNVAIGAGAMVSHISGNRNVAMGTDVLFSDLTGSQNTAVGSDAMFQRKSGFNNTALGFSALYNNKNGTSNVSVGTESLFFDTTGIKNTAIGFSALKGSLSGQRNVGIGDSAGAVITTGTLNLFAGSHADATVNNLTNAAAIGANATVAQSNALVLGSISGINTATATVSVGIGTNTPDARLHIVRNGASGGTYHPESGLILENSSIVTMQLSTPNGVPALISSGNAATAQRSGISFEADSSISFNSGGSLNRVFISNTGNLGINESTPNARLHVVGNSGPVAGGLVQASTVALIENNTGTNYLQMLSPVTGTAGLISGTSATTIRSGILMNADSSVSLLAGGGFIRMFVDNNGYVGVRTAAPLSYHDINGSVGNAISTSTVSTTLDEFDHTHIILPTASAVVITLPAASTCARREYTIVNEDNSVQAISSYVDFTGAASITLLANTSITVQSNGTSWFRIR